MNPSLRNKGTKGICTSAPLPSVQVLDRHLKGSATVLQIAHDLQAIEGYDKVAVMADGAIAEIGPPTTLLAAPGSKLAALAASAGIPGQ